MTLELFSYLEANAKTLIIVHIFLSILLAILLSNQIIHRFVTQSKELYEKDLVRFREFQTKSFFHKWLFNVSLHKNNEYTSLVFIFLYNFSIPVIGYFSSIWMTWYLLHIKYEKKVSKTNSLNLDEFKTSFLQIERVFGEGAMNSIMTNEFKSTDDKLFALSSLSKLGNIPPENLKIIRQALTSTDDEVRLFGYAIINKEEMRINAKINKNIVVFQDKESSDEQKAIAAKELAHLYWELVYKELSHDSLKENFLNEVVKYLEVAKAYFFEEIDKLEELDALFEKSQKKFEASKIGVKVKRKYFKLMQQLKETREKLKEYKNVRIRLYILTGRVYMSQGEYEEAAEAFSLAQELNESDSSFIVPYLAEVHFMNGNYNIVRAVLNNAIDLELNSKLYPIIDQWKVADKKSVA